MVHFLSIVTALALPALAVATIQNNNVRDPYAQPERHHKRAAALYHAAAVNLEILAARSELPPMSTAGPFPIGKQRTVGCGRRSTSSASQPTHTTVAPGGDPHHPSPTTHKAAPTTTAHPTTKREPTSTKHITSQKPKPTTSIKQAPPPPHTKKITSTKKMQPTTSKKAESSKPTPHDGESGLTAGVKNGQGTWYATGLGSCGITNTDSDYIAAVSHILYDKWPGATANPNNNPICKRKALAHYKGKSVTVTITDRCTGCKEWDLDFSPAAFSQLADQGIGRMDITWTFI